MSDTIAAVSTGAAVSAIGIVRVSGPDAVTYAKRLFDAPLTEDRKLYYGKLSSADGKLLDMCMCTVSHAPNSYTGEDTAEFQCHGSPIVLREVLEELFSLGARQANPGEFTKRAFLNGRMELSSAEAVADLIDAETREAALNAAGQLSGAIGAKTEKIYSDLTDISAHFHVILDYPDDDLEKFEIPDLKEHIRTLDGLLKTYSRGRTLNTGIPTAIVGKPNAGKSSLLNALVGYDRAIVTDIPGTTRDTIEEKINLDGVCLKLIDTAGIRETDNEIEKMGVERSLEAIRGADLIINVIDGTTDDEPMENALAVYNKCDLPGFKGGEIAVSAITGEGIDRLIEEIKNRFPLPNVPAGEILTNARQAEAIRTAREYLAAADDALDKTPDIVLTEIEGAMKALGELSGRSIREDVTNRIFERFCVGK